MHHADRVRVCSNHIRKRCANHRGCLYEWGGVGRAAKSFKQKQSTYRLSVAPSGRARCRRCRAVIAKGETRLEVSAFVRPGRYTLLLRCTAPSCIDARLSAAILSVYKSADRVPVDAALEGGAEARRVVDAITSAGPTAQ